MNDEELKQRIKDNIYSLDISMWPDGSPEYTSLEKDLFNWIKKYILKK